MNKREFDKKFKAIIKSHKLVAVELKNSDVVYADDYENTAFALLSVWLKWKGDRIALTDYGHIDHLD